ncbi:MAG: hypothetical protein KGZ97_08270 [Bacteroidetes bacterium]|nr:hypothetical protein [Bacteroidota bacterium]
MNILKYISLFLLLISNSILGNNPEEINLFRPSIRIGFDASGLVKRLWQPETMQLEFSADAEIKPNWFIAAEAGYLDIDIIRNNFDYNANGLFLRLGADYNVLTKKPSESNDVVLISMRYGYSGLSHSASRVNIIDPYWGDYTTAIDSEIVNSHWLELGFSLKTELFKGLFLGWAIRGRYLIYRSQDPLLEPYNIPGFGNLRKNNTGFSLHYGLFYRIPL